MDNVFPLNIETERLYLDVLNEDFAPEVLDFFNRNKGYFEQFEPILSQDFYTQEHQEQILEYEFDRILDGDMIRYWLSTKDNPGVIIGTISYRNIIRRVYNSCTVGYKMDMNYQNKGYCTEALDYTLKNVIAPSGIHRVEAFIMPSNAPSLHMVEKVGFAREGLLKDKFTLNDKRLDHYLYAYIADN